MRSDRIAEWMSTPPIVVPPTTTLADAQHLMEERHVRRLPVVRNEQLVGIVSWGDLRAAWPSAATTLSGYEWRAAANGDGRRVHDSHPDHRRALWQRA